MVKLGILAWTQTLLDYPNRSDVITRVLESRRGRKKKVREKDVKINQGLETDVKLLALGMEDGATSKGRHAAFETREEAETILP